MKFRHEIQKAQLRPDITPLIDVVFLLLIFFMLSSRFVYTTNIKVKLPRAQTSQAVHDTIVTITITKDSELFLDDKYIMFSDLHKIFKAMEKGKVAIVADKDTPFGSVIKVWDFARKYKLKEINIRTDT
ncbi:MAG: biopolymer transporter ExbD [Candidatus Omnitrophica bacterium]|nr:biopolymer transporter ExbD [Candidatus Omnitrophota bacterium]